MSGTDNRVLQEVREILAPLGKTYKVVKILGEGAMGYVVLVEHRLHGLRAMKLLHRGLLQHQKLKTRFDREAMVMYRLFHPNLVKVHNLAEVGGYPYIEMDYHAGGTLEEHLVKFGAMPPRQAVEVTIAILRGLQLAHQDMIIHRDIKPQNVLLAEDGTPKVTDFGIAHLGEATRAMTKAGAPMGTYAYMPPEQLLGQPVDARADIHAVGVTLYMMLTCGPIAATPAAFIDTVDANPDWFAPIHPLLQRVIRRATAKDLELRLESAEAFIAELEACLPQLPENSPDTPALGTAPGFKQTRDGTPNDPPVGLTAVPPASTRGQPGYGPPSGDQSDLHVSSVPELGEPADAPGTWSDPGFHTVAAGDIDDEVVTPSRTKRFVVPAVVVLVMALVGTWFALRPGTPPVETLVVEVTPPAPAPEPLPELSVPEPEPEVEVAEVMPTPEPVAPTPIERVKAKTPPREITPVVVATPPPEQTVTVTQSAEVRLILVGDTTATVTLTGAGGTHTLTSGSKTIPQGTYKVVANITGRDGEQTGSLSVTPGLTTIRCDARFGQCKF